MSFEEFRKRVPKSRQKRVDRPVAFTGKASKVSAEEAAKRKEAIFSRAPPARPAAPSRAERPRTSHRSSRREDGFKQRIRAKEEVRRETPRVERPRISREQQSVRDTREAARAERRSEPRSAPRVAPSESPRGTLRGHMKTRAHAAVPSSDSPRASPRTSHAETVEARPTNRPLSRAEKLALASPRDADRSSRTMRAARDRARLDEPIVKEKREFVARVPGTERVQKFIAASGLCSRRDAEQMIKEGRVTVNGTVIRLGDCAFPKDKIAVNGAPIPTQTKKYILLNKPKGFVTTRKDIYGNKTVMDLIDVDERVYPVGRLDKDTTGLLLFTNDGAFANHVMHPRYELEKTYIATLDKSFDGKLMAVFEKGVQLKEGLVRAKVRMMGPGKVSVTLHQGFNHVVKRIMKAHGYWVKDLTRVAIGDLKITMPVGAYRELTEAEVNAMLSRSPVRTPPRHRS